MSTLYEMSTLPNKMKLTFHPKKLVKFSEINVSFYMKYASVVFKALKKPRFQEFLHWMLKRENIEEHTVTNVNVMTFPSRKENGNALAGRCNSKGEIRIYPKRLEFCRKLMRKYGKEIVQSYIKNRAKATLIHEILHVKYSNDEEKVRELTRQYFTVFTQHRNLHDSNVDKILKMLFKQ